MELTGADEIFLTKPAARGGVSATVATAAAKTEPQLSESSTFDEMMEVTQINSLFPVVFIFACTGPATHTRRGGGRAADVCGEGGRGGARSQDGAAVGVVCFFWSELDRCVREDVRPVQDGAGQVDLQSVPRGAVLQRGVSAGGMAGGAQGGVRWGRQEGSVVIFNSNKIFGGCKIKFRT